MPRNLVCLIVSVALFSACKGETPSDSDLNPTAEGAAHLNLHSPAFAPGGPIPSVYTCDGRDTSPPLEWDAGPDGTESFALIFDDPDAPSGTWVHWVLYSLPADATRLDAGIPAISPLPNGARQGVNDFKKTGYGGPCPPSGTHRYFFRLYALDTTLALNGKVTKADVVRAMEGHILATGELMGTYAR